MVLPKIEIAVIKKVDVSLKNVYDMDEIFCSWYLCPECKYDFAEWNREEVRPSYCPGCGSKIKWVE